MIVKCPNCECPNDADQAQCRQCGARIPLSMREKAMVPRGQQQQAPRHSYDDGDVVDRRGGPAGGARSLRGDIVPQQGAISGYSQSQYAPPPTEGSAARSASGREYVDQSQMQVQYGQQPAPTPAYADRAAWEAQQRAHYQQSGWPAGQQAAPSQAQMAQAAAAAGQTDPMAAAAAAAARPGMPAPPPRRMPVPPPPGPAPPPGAGAPMPPHGPGAPLPGRGPGGPPHAAGPGAPRPGQSGVPALPKPMSGEATIRDKDEQMAPAKQPERRRDGASLIFLDDVGNRKEVLPLRKGKTIVGRTEGEVLLTHDPYVSPWHAQITVRRTDMLIKDMYTLNGIYKRIDRQAVLQDGDKFLIGRQVVQFRHGWPRAEPNEQGTRPLGGPNPATAARVLVLTESGEVADLRLIRETLTIGRSGCDVSLPEDPDLADKHVQIQRDRDHFLLIDLNSQDGVYLNIRGEAEIKDGDTIQMGRQRMMVEREQDEQS